MHYLFHQLNIHCTGFTTNFTNVPATHETYQAKHASKQHSCTSPKISSTRKPLCKPFSFERNLNFCYMCASTVRPKKKDYEFIKTFLGTFLLSSKVWLTWRARELSRNHTFQSLCSQYRTVCHDLCMSFSNRSLLCYYMKQRRIANWQTNPH